MFLQMIAIRKIGQLMDLLVEKTWVKLDEQSNCLHLNGGNLVHTFQKQNENESNKYSKYLRNRLTGPNFHGDNYLYICSIEFYGKII